MPTISSRSCVIAASPQEIWKTLADFDKISRWAKDVSHASYTTEAHEGIGTTRRVHAGGLTLLETVVVWDPPSTMAYTIQGLPKVVQHVTNSWHLAEEGSRTRVTLTTTIEASTRFGGSVAAAVLSRVLSHVAGQLLAGLTTFYKGHQSSSLQP
jgi:carbon monoxide dehydrogenase subunit G